MTTLTRDELLERLKADPRFREARKPGEAVVIVGAGASNLARGKLQLAPMADGRQGTIKHHTTEEQMKLYSQNVTRGNRSRQIFSILIGYACRRQSITYGELGDLLGYGGVGHSMIASLASINHWCVANNLPALNSIVVLQDSGLPGEGIPVADVVKQQAETFKTDWYDVMPPTAEELEAAYAETGIVHA